MKSLKVSGIPVAAALAAALASSGAMGAIVALDQNNTAAEFGGAGFAAANVDQFSALVVGAERMALDAAADANGFVTTPALAIELGSNTYANGDTVTISVSNATVFSGASLAITCATKVGAVNNVAITTTGAAGPITLTYSPTASTGNNLVFTVGGVDGTGVFNGTHGKICTLSAGGIRILKSSLSSAKAVGLDWVAATPNGAIYDRLQTSSATVGLTVPTAHTSEIKFAGVAQPVNIIVSHTQLKNATTATRNVATNELDVGFSSTFLSGATNSALTRAGQSTFGAAGTGDDNRRTFTWNTRNEAAATGTGLLAGAAADNVISRAAAMLVRTTLTGDFNFLDDDANGCTAVDLTRGAGRLTYTLSATGGTASTPASVLASIASDCSSMSFTFDHPTNAKDIAHTVTLSLRGYDGSTASLNSAVGRTLAATSFGYTTEYVQKTGNSPVVATDTSRFSHVGAGGSIAAAPTTLSIARIEYLPFGAGISHVLYANNTDSTTAAVAQFRARNALGVECPTTSFQAVTVNPRSTASLADAITNGVRACYGNTEQRLYVEVIWSGAVGRISAIYNSNNNRVAVAVAQ